ncbi:F-box domain-containing protein [Mycena sanguinolenta]|uniref:F-box domain-containing protein n=1 Tax=Mycena sanguinolenta TaxID=230812 RepID=A0A8H6Y0J5_9AGAR|nr:F-box domain-containing protein [Mycena sanguinolenta]
MPLVCEKCGHNNTWATSSVSQDTILATGTTTATSDRAALAEIEIEMARFKSYSTSYISALEGHKKAVELRLQAVVYPILSLPMEITARIFVECLPEDGHRRSSRKHAPLLLMRVCRRWKDIAVSISELWNVLPIRCLNVSRTSDETMMVRRGLLAGLAPWFSRAQARPLSLTVYQNRRFSKGREVYDNISRTEQLDISPILSRLGRLDVSLLADEIQSLASWNTPFPRLRCLSLSSPDSVLSDVLRNAPLLRELCWSRDSRASLDFRWFASTTLTKLEISPNGYGVLATQFIDILQNFPALADLACVVDMRTFNPQPPLTFPNLRSLNLSYDFSRYDYLEDMVAPIRLLDLLTLPHLNRLHCTLALHSEVVSSFLTRSACIIRELSCEFRGDGPIESDIWLVLQLFPSVETLAVGLQTDICYLLDGIDTKHYDHRRAPHLLPQMQHLTVSYGGLVASRSPITPINYSDIIDIVHRRRGDSDMVELRSLHIMINESTEWNWYPGDSLAAEFGRLISAGLDFTIGVDGKVKWPRARTRV